MFFKHRETRYKGFSFQATSRTFLTLLETGMIWIHSCIKGVLIPPYQRCLWASKDIPDWQQGLHAAFPTEDFFQGQYLRTGLYMIQFRHYWLFSLLCMCLAFCKCCGEYLKKKRIGDEGSAFKELAGRKETPAIFESGFGQRFWCALLGFICTTSKQGKSYCLHLWRKKSQGR
jgi:hypothetical protein